MSADTDEIDTTLNNAIRVHGGTYPAADARDDMATVLREARADNEAHGEDPDQPFFCFTISGGVAVFTVYQESLDIYVVHCDPADEWNLIARFEPLALADISTAIEILRDDYGKVRPDLTVDPESKNDWLSGHPGGPSRS
jgi:hypothetical protein